MEPGGLIHFFYLGVEKVIYPPLIFLGVGAMTDFGPMIANPSLMILGAFAHIGIFIALIGAKLLGFSIFEVITILLGVSIGSTMKADTFLTIKTLEIVTLGLIAFMTGTAGGVLGAKFLNKLSGGKINPLVGSAGIASVPIAARVSHSVAIKENPYNFLIMHAMGPNLAGVFGTAIAGGIMLVLLGVH